MAISPIGDIVAEVARAADPNRIKALAGRLTNGDPTSLFVTGRSFENSFSKAQNRSISFGGQLQDPTRNLATKSKDTVNSIAHAGRKLESLLFRQAFELMLPQNMAGTEKSGKGSGFWRSIIAETLAESVAGATSLGIADSIAKISVKKPIS